jgi:hemerythrin superfamily protein
LAVTTSGVPLVASVTLHAPARPTEREMFEMDAIELLTEQHRDVDTLFERFEDSDGDERGSIADEVVSSLRMHTSIEEEIFYPAVREGQPDAEKDVLEGFEEHHAVELLLDELDDLAPGDERFEAKFTVVKEYVQHHVKEEEEELFPKVREALGEDVLTELGDRMATRVDELSSSTADNTKEELYGRAQELGIEGRSQMSKRELARAVRQAG